LVGVLAFLVKVELFGEFVAELEVEYVVLLHVLLFKVMKDVKRKK